MPLAWPQEGVHRLVGIIIRYTEDTVVFVPLPFTKYFIRVAVSGLACSEKV